MFSCAMGISVILQLFVKEDLRRQRADENEQTYSPKSAEIAKL